MAWGAQTWLKITKEASYAVRPVSAPESVWVRLHADDAFTMRPSPMRQIIRSADAGNRRRQVVSARTEYAGKLSTILYPSQAAFLLGAACNLVSNDLASYSLDFFDSVRVQGYLGAKVKGLSLSSKADQDYLTLSIDWIAQKLDDSLAALPQPDDASFPDERPYEHYESAGNLTLGGTALTKFRGVDLAVNNVLVPTWDEQRFISGLYYCGRDVDASLDLQYVSTSFRAALEAQTPLALVLKWLRPGTPAKSVTVDLKSRDYVASVADRLPLAGVGYQTVAVQTFYDPSSGVATDASLAVA